MLIFRSLLSLYSRNNWHIFWTWRGVFLTSWLTYWFWGWLRICEELNRVPIDWFSRGSVHCLLLNKDMILSGVSTDVLYCFSSCGYADATILGPREGVQNLHVTIKLSFIFLIKNVQVNVCVNKCSKGKPSNQEACISLNWAHSLSPYHYVGFE